MRLKRIKRRYAKLLKGVAYLAAGIAIYQLILCTLPLFSGNLKKMAVVSAGLSFINGGIALVEQDIKNPNQSSAPPVPEDTAATNSESKPPEKTDNTSSQTAAVPEDTVFQPEEPAPPRIENSGNVVKKYLGPGATPQFIKLGDTNAYVKNLSKLSAEQVLSLNNTPLGFTFDPNITEPQVLIYHTHATESYQPYDADWYDLAYNARSDDNSKNMVAVGDVIAQKLKAAGIGVIHDTTQHDNPSYTGAYDKSRVTIENYLKQYPSIKMVLDVHRDAIQNDNVITAPVTEINGKKTAQIMIISCCDNGTGRIPNYMQNFSFACQLQRQMELDYPTLTRPILFDDRFYNQDLSVGGLLLEIGGHGNTLSEAKNAASMLGDSLVNILKPPQ